MRRTPTVMQAALALLLILLCGRWARADHFTISLELSDGTTTQKAGTEQEPAKTPQAAKRPVLETTQGAKCVAKYKLSCNAKELLKDVLVHFYVVKIDRQGQDPPPLEPKDVLIESAQTMDFSPGTTTSAELKFSPEHPGIYLVRVETQGTAETANHEHYAEMEMVVK